MKTTTSSRCAMIGMCLATFLGWLDLTIVNTALPALQNFFGVNDTRLQWVMNALLLALSALMVIMGKLADRFGRRRLLYTGMALLVASSVAAALSESFTALVVARFFQGIAIGILYTAPMALVSSVWPTQVPKAMGLMIGTGGFALAFGPVAGGFLVHTFSWHAIFWINLPVTLAAFLFCVAGGLPASKAEEQSKIDFPGAFLLAIGLGLLIFTTVSVHTAALSTTVISYAVVLVLFIFFYLREMHTAAPIIDFHLFANRHFIAGAMANFFVAFFYCIDFFFIPLHLHALGYHSSMVIGWVLLPPSLMFAVLSLFSNRIANTFGPRNTMLAGYALLIVSALLQIALAHSTHLGPLIFAYALFGSGWALILPPSFGIAITSLPQEMGGVAVGSAGTFHNLGGTVGLALGSALGFLGGISLILATSVLAFLLIAGVLLTRVEAKAILPVKT